MMRNSGKCITLFVVLLTITGLKAQKSLNPAKALFSYVFTSDSISGFDESSKLQEWNTSGNSDQLDFLGFMYHARRDFVNNKYNLVSPEASAFRYIPPSMSPMAAPCVNEGFEAGNISGWTSTRGVNANTCTYGTTPTSIGLAAPYLAMQTTPFVDPYAGAIPNSPFAGSNVIKMNDDVASGNMDVVRLTQGFPVTASNFLYEFAYIAINNGPHGCCNQPFMYVRLRDCVGNLLACPIFSITPPGVGCPGTGPTTWTTVAGNNYNTGWQKYSIDLTSYIGSCVTVEVSVGDCSLGGHWGYAYFDSNCSNFGITLNNTTVIPAPTQTITVQAPCATTATLTAPGGLSPYNWNGPAGSGVTNSTLQTVSSSVPGNYTITMTPVGVCTPIFRIVTLQFVPPLTVTATPTLVCAGSSSTLSATGATNYTWSTGPTTSTTVVTPGTTTIYTVTANTSTCTTTGTVQVATTLNPTVTISASTPSICTGSSVTFTANGATNYTWNPGALTGSVVTFTPLASQTYTAIGSIAGGCTGTSTVFVNVVASPTVIAFTSTATICSGGSANLFAGGATTYTWNPGGLSGPVVAVSPTVTTTYTVTGSNGGSCTGTSTVTVNVSTPTLVPASSPAVLCSGNSATLSVSGAVTYTWNPGALSGSTVVVIPGITTTYTVSGTNALGCVNSQTLLLTVNTTPTVTASSNPTVVCSGATATLTGAGATTYTWNPGGLSGTSVTVTPVAFTTYTVTGSNGPCSNTATLALNVNPNPTVTAAGSPTAFCSGASSTLTATGAVSYTWNPGALPGGTVTITPVTSTTYSVTGVNAFGCVNTNTVFLSVTTTPTVIASASPTALCVGSTATLNASGATTYTWNPGGLSGASPTVSPASSTVYTVTGANGACTNTQTVSLAVVSGPTITASTSPTLICSGSSATLTGSGAVSYTWNPGNLTGANVTVTPAVTTIYTVTGANATGCTNTATTSITVNPSPTVSAAASPTSMCVGSTATLTGSGATSYTWNPGGLSGTTVTVSPAISTTYTMTGAMAGCTSTGTVFLLVSPIPTVNATSNPVAMCSGGTATLTGNGATTYTWNPGALTGSTVAVNPIVTTTYTVTGATAGCSATNTLILTVNPSPAVTAAASPTIICSGGTATLSANGATTYTWIPGPIFGGTVTVSPGTTTTYSVRGSNGTCTGTTSVLLVVTPSPTVSATSSPAAICIGATATLTGSGATSYTWNPGGLSGTTVTVSPASTTVYTVTGANGACTNTSTVSLTVNPTPTVSAAVNPTVICSGNTATLTGSGAVSYTWNPGALTGISVTVSPVVTTIYSVTGSSAGGCTNTNTVSLIVNGTPTLTATSNPTAICSGNTATLTGTGATSYTWNPGALTGAAVTVSPLITTIYTLTGTNGSGCSSTKTVTLNVTITPTVTASVSPTIVCSGSTATLTGNGATTYTWNPGALSGATVAVTPVSSTVYTLTGANGTCSNAQTVSLTVIASPTVIASASPTAICSGASSTLSAAGAVSYTWNPGGLSGASVTVSPVASMIYTVTGTNGSGCTNSQTVAVNVTTTPTVTAASSPTAICAGATATLTGTGAASYTWNPGGLSGASVTVSPVASTIYTVTGANGSCTNTKTVSLTVNANPTVAAVSNPTVICSGASATITGSGAASYTWNPGVLTGISITVSPTITTIYTVTGSNGTCSNTNTVSLTVNPTPTLTATSNPTALCSGNTATLTGTGAASYTWNPGALTTATVAVSPAVTTIYTLTGASAAGCTSSKTLTLTVTTTPTVTAVSNPSIICAGSTATLTGNGATTYSWNPGALVGATVAVTPAASTIYTLTGGNGSCTNTKTVSVTVVPGPTLTIVASKTSFCSGDSAFLQASGAVSYTWNPGSIVSSGISVTPLTTTIYTVTGANIVGCTSSKTIQITVTPTPTLTASSTPASLCAGASATLNATGATSYTWNPGALTGSSVVVTPTATTVYNVTGANGSCTSSKTLTLTVSPNPTLTASGNPTLICSGTTATLTGTGAASYTWNPGALTGATVTVTPAITTTYTLTGATGLGCTATKTVSITVNPGPILTAVSNPTAICSGNSATLTSTGAISYTWSPGALSGGTVIVTPSATTIYSVTGSNAGGCTTTKTIVLNVTSTPTLTASSTPTLLCRGSSATLTATGATTYTWNPGALAGGTVVVSPLGPTTYTVRGANGACVSTKTLNLNVVPTPTVNAFANPNPICAGSSATLVAFGAATFTWNPGALTGNSVVVTPTSTTIYTVTGATPAGCTNSRTLTVNVIPSPTIIAVSNPTSVCTGGSATLTAAGAAGYTWTPGPVTGSSVAVTPTATTIYTVTGANIAGCRSTNTINLAVLPFPTVTVSGSPTVICSGSTATLTGTGATTYSWSPGALTGSMVTVTPTTTTIYTLTGANGLCTNAATLSLSVIPVPTVTAAESATAICAGTTVTLTSAGATTYTWNPGAVTGSTILVTPTVTTTYTVSGNNGSGCTGTKTITVLVNTPTVTIAATTTAICVSGTVGITASGASTYTWSPGGMTTNTIVVSPTVTTVYTVSATNVSGCTGSDTIRIAVNSIPSVTASATPTTVCAGYTTTLTAAGATTYTWNPGALSGATVVSTPTASTVYTLTAANGACQVTQTLQVNTISSPTNVIAGNSGPITCMLSSVNLTGSTTATNVVYTWIGPGSFTSAVQNPTNITVPGTYSFVVSYTTTGCSTTATTAVIANTTVPITATIIPSTCTGTVSNNNGTILVSGFIATDEFDFVAGSTYTGTATYATAAPVPTTGVVINTLSNPLLPKSYTIRFFGINGCHKDTTLILLPNNCVPNPDFGLAKAVGTPSLQTNGSYNVTYTVVAVNSGTNTLSNVVLTESLTATFPAPATYSVISPPIVVNAGSSLSINPGFNGNANSSITTATGSAMPPSRKDTIVFTVNIIPNGFFGPFNNSVFGAVASGTNTLFDISTTGLNPDPDADNNFGNNSLPTVLTLQPSLFFGLTKEGSLSSKLDDGSYDITYTVKVHNLGNDTLRNVTVKDSIALTHPAQFTVKNGPVATGSLTADAGYNGSGNINLLIPATSKIAPGTVSQIMFTINVKPDTVTVIKNSAFGSAIHGTLVVSDTSNAGSNPDTNGNSICNETVDNVPTVLIISDSQLFIPEGFSPNGDGKNDLFVIRGLGNTVENTITVYNRWGNKVYSKNNYDNTWDGSPNAGGTLGNQKLPQGTYYYILEFKNSDMKPVYGFVILQY